MRTFRYIGPYNKKSLQRKIAREIETRHRKTDKIFEKAQKKDKHQIKRKKKQP